MSATNPKLFGIGRLRIGAENTYNDTATTLRYVKSSSVDLSGLEAALLEDTQQRKADCQLAGVVGPHLGSVTTTHFVSGWSTAGTGIAVAPEFDDEFGTGTATTSGFHCLMSALGSAVGNIRGGGFTSDVTGNTTTTITATTATSFQVGQPICWDSTDGVQVGWITDITGGVMTLLQTLDAGGGQDVSGTKLYGAYHAWQTTGTIYHDIQHDATNLITSYTLEWLGHDDDDKVVITGAVPTGYTMSFATGELPVMTVTWGIGGWTESSTGGLDGAGASEAWVEPLPEAVQAGWVAKGSSMATSLRISSLEVDVQLERPAIMDPSASNGVGGYGPALRKPKVSFSVFRDFSEEVDEFLQQSGESYTFRFGSDPGKAIAICVPNGRVMSLPTRGDSDGAVTSEVEIVANEYTGDTGTIPSDGTTGIDSDFRIGFC